MNAELIYDFSLCTRQRRPQDRADLAEICAERTQNPQRSMMQHSTAAMQAMLECQAKSTSMHVTRAKPLAFCGQHFMAAHLIKVSPITALPADSARAVAGGRSGSAWRVQGALAPASLGMLGPSRQLNLVQLQPLLVVLVVVLDLGFLLGRNFSGQNVPIDAMDLQRA